MSKTVTVESLREELIRLGLSKEDAAAIKSRASLMAKVRELSQSEYNPFEEDVEVEGSQISDFGSKTHSENEDSPRLGEPLWQDYVLSLLNDDEYADVNGNRFPKAAGLRRVAQQVLGDIIDCGPITVFPAKDDSSSGRATVIFQVKIRWKEGLKDWYDLNEIQSEDIRTFSDVAEAWHGNTPDTFAVHPSATASSRAMGRALKSALCINVLTAEEMTNDKDPKRYSGPAEKVSNGEYDENAQISGTQKTLIKDVCEKLDVDVDKFINIGYYVHGEKNRRYASLDSVTKEKATLMIKQLNIYQTCTDGSELVPEEIKVK